MKVGNLSLNSCTGPGRKKNQKVLFTAELLLFKNRKLCKQGQT